jgi:hypothetical protein
MNIATVAPIWQRRNAPNSIYPLRGADGMTWAERKELAMRQKEN